MSYKDLHIINKRATPPQLMKYKLSIQLHRLYNGNEPIHDWLALNHNQNLSRRQIYFETIKQSNFRVGNNFLSNRLHILNKQIPLQWLNAPLNSMKIKCKQLFLQLVITKSTNLPRETHGDAHLISVFCLFLKLFYYFVSLLLCFYFILFYYDFPICAVVPGMINKLFFKLKLNWCSKLNNKTFDLLTTSKLF